MEITYLDLPFGCQISARKTSVFWWFFGGSNFRPSEDSGEVGILKLVGPALEIHHQNKYPKERLGTWMSQEVSKWFVNGL